MSVVGSPPAGEVLQLQMNSLLITLFISTRVACFAAITARDPLGLVTLQPSRVLFLCTDNVCECMRFPSQSMPSQLVIKPSRSERPCHGHGQTLVEELYITYISTSKRNVQGITYLFLPNPAHVKFAMTAEAKATVARHFPVETPALVVWRPAFDANRCVLPACLNICQF